uniref:Ubiquitin associated protein 2-like n=1 Tax=Neolamprologus brichardi TaxID=32507 RepID=A0A3Q4HK33_NEOBR
MMTSMGGNRARGNWEQTQGQTQSQTQHKQRPQATAEQIRLAQMISDHNDDFEEKVKQLIDITGKDQDESMIALHDCNGDVNRAINVLLEGSPDTDSWEMVGKKKGVSGQKETSQAETGDEGKENREKGGEKDAARRRGGAPRKGRGASRGREFRGQENGLDGGKTGVAGRGAERGRRGRGRGRGAVGCVSNQNKGTFNPADYAEPAQTEENYGGGSTWNNTGSVELEEGASAWRSATEEWGTEDWNEDLSETKIFTASSVASVPPPQENVTITKGQRIDLAVLLGKTPPSSSSETENAPMEATQPPSLSQSLVFSNSKQGVPLSQTSSSTPYTQHNMVSMLSKGFGEVGEPKGASTGTTGSQFLEQYKTAQALAQLAAQHSQTGPPNTTPSSWDTSAASLGQYDMKAQPESAIHAPFTKRQPYQATTSTSSMLDVFLQDKGLPPSSSVSSSSSLPQQTTSSPHVVPPPASSLPKMAGVPSLGQQVSPSSSDAQGSSPLPLQQHKIKQQKKRASINTKIPAMAVEMPGSTDISGLNLQFGALQFGSEPVLPEYESSSATTTPGNQVQNSLYTSPSRLVLPKAKLFQYQKPHQNNIYTSTPVLSNSSQMDLYDQRPSQTRRYPPSVSSSPQKDLQPKVNVDGDSSLHSSSFPSSVSAVPSSSVPCSSSSVAAAQVSLGAPQASSVGSATVSAPSGLGPVSSLAMGLNTASMGAPVAAAAAATASVSTAASTIPSSASSSSTRSSAATVNSLEKCLPLHTHPKLCDGYVVTQFLVFLYCNIFLIQDYYSIPFAATPTTALTGREGSLTSNPYSGDLSKFGRADASSPAPATTLAQTQQNQSQTHHTTQQPFLNPALPPGYSYTSLPYYTGMPGLPNTFQYGPAVFPVAPTSSKQHGVNVGVNASATPFQQASGYGSHGYSTGVSVTSSNTGVPDISGSVYTKTQSFEKQGFHAGTPAASFSLPSALGSGGPINPPAAAGYAPAPFMHILTPHQQPHSQILHHHLQQDGQSGTGQRSQNASIQQKSQINKSAYNSYSWGAN